MPQSLRSRTLTLLLAWAVSVALEASTIPPDRIPWQKAPIAVELSTGLERTITFPGPVKVGLPDKLEGALRVQSIAGTVYLLANRPFPASRVLVRRLDDPAVYVLDVSAAPGNEGIVPLVVFHPDEDIVAGEGTSSSVEPTSHGYVTLTRFAAQQLYAPARLLENLPGVVRVPVKAEPVTLVRGAAVEAVPLIAWRSGNLYVTAVRLTNQTKHPQVLDPRTLRGAWLAATFQHNRLLPAGNEADRTVAYLISARPFAASL
jgi:integrating conjugative element protein (TIGR03749 family)